MKNILKEANRIKTLLILLRKFIGGEFEKAHVKKQLSQRKQSLRFNAIIERS